MTSLTLTYKKMTNVINSQSNRLKQDDFNLENIGIVHSKQVKQANLSVNNSSKKRKIVLKY